MTILLCCFALPGTAALAQGTQNEEAKLLASDGEEAARFGSSVGISGDAAICGAPYTSGYIHDPGRAYVYRYDPVAQTWNEEQKLTASDGDISDYFGDHVAIDGDFAVIGAWGDDDRGSWAGAAYVFRYLSLIHI